MIFYMFQKFHKMQYSNGLIGGYNVVRILVLSDNSGYFIITKNSIDNNIPGVCKYLYSSPTTNSWQDFPSLTTYPQSVFMINDSQFAITGIDISMNYYFYKVTFGNVVANWANKILWSYSPSWAAGKGEIMLSSDNTNVYTFFPFGVAAYLHFITFDVNTGSVVGTRYVSNSVISTLKFII